MKKMNWLIALLSVFSLTFVACGGDDVDDTKKPTPKPETPVEQSFDIQIETITFNSVEFTVTPTDLEADYLCMLYDAATVESFRKDEYVIQTLYQELETEARAKGLTLEEYLPEFLDRGVLSASSSQLSPESDYYILVVGVDAANGCNTTTALFKQKFTTESAPEIEVTFDVETTVEDVTATIKVTPSDNEAIWFLTCLPSAQYAQYLDPSMYNLTPEQIILGLAQDQLQQLMNNGMSIKQAINASFHIGPLTLTATPLVYNTEYTNVIAGFVIDQDANITIATPVTTTTFTTGDIGEVDLSFEITVDNIEAMRASIKVVPSDLTQTFYWQIGAYDGFSTAEQVMNSVYPYGGGYKGVQDYTGGPGSPYKMTLDAPDTEYFVIAFGYAPGAGITTEPTMVTFRTLPAPTAEETTFDITVDQSSISPYNFALNITASHNTTYYFIGVTPAEYFDAEAIVSESDAMMDEIIAYYRENYDPNYTAAQALSSNNFYLGSFSNVNVNLLEPNTTYMAYVCALDINTGHVAKIHTFENIATTKSLGEVQPTIEYIKYFSGREENGIAFGQADYTAEKAIVVVKYGNLDNARSLFDYMSEGDTTDIIEYSDSEVWSLVSKWNAVSIKQPYSFYVVDWEEYQTILAYVKDKSGLQGGMIRSLACATIDNKSNIQELFDLVAELNAQSQSATRFSVPQSLVVEE
ncbi:MAG: hypothetical protein J6U93_00115 [Alistipes sp.]|nr:hypothetical protein [Alistipes sp.]